MQNNDRDKKEQEGRRHAGYGSDKGVEEATEHQRDPQQDVQHMPRHWQEPGTRGEIAGQANPGPDQREMARGNQYGEAGRAATEQLHEELTEHGQEPTPQRRENEQLPKRSGERESDLPTPSKPERQR